MITDRLIRMDLCFSEPSITPKSSQPDGDKGNPEVTKQLDQLGNTPF